MGTTCGPCRRPAARASRYNRCLNTWFCEYGAGICKLNSAHGRPPPSSFAPTSPLTKALFEPPVSSTTMPALKCLTCALQLCSLVRRLSRDFLFYNGFRRYDITSVVSWLFASNANKSACDTPGCGVNCVISQADSPGHGRGSPPRCSTFGRVLSLQDSHSECIIRSIEEIGWTRRLPACDETADLTCHKRYATTLTFRFGVCPRTAETTDWNTPVIPGF